MRRLALILGVVLIGGVLGTFAVGAGDGAADSPSYYIELSNAFNLTTGGDFKIAGVRAGKITGFDINRSDDKALVKVTLDNDRFGGLRADVHCQSRPQSLIGEYFITCTPGTSKRRLAPGSIVPASHTFSTIPMDLVQDLLRLPYRQRLTLIINELGTGLAGNGAKLNTAIHRAVPALRQTDRVLDILHRERDTIEDLAGKGDRVVHALAANRHDVARFVTTANRTAVASAARRDALASGLHLLPGFLDQLRPTLADLQTAADRQTPALRNLDAAAHPLTRFLNDLTPFTRAATPAVLSLGRASVVGDRAVKDSKDTVRLLKRFAHGTPELSQNLRIVARHLDDRRFGIEHDIRAAQQLKGGPGGDRYNGLEALLQFFYDTANAINQYNGTSHILGINLIVNECAQYTDKALIESKGGVDSPFYKNCSANAEVGPTQPNLNAPDVGEGAPATPSAHTPGARGAKAHTPAADRGPGGESSSLLHYLLGP